jgi:hypothetical protein
MIVADAVSAAAQWSLRPTGAKAAIEQHADPKARLAAS